MDNTPTLAGPPTHPADRLLELLREEDRLLTSSRDALLELRAALRRGRLGDVKHLIQNHAEYASWSAKVAAEREATAHELGSLHGLSKSACTLRALADLVGDPWATLFRHARERLTALTGEIGTIQRGNATLIETLRSFFRDVLQGLAPEAATPVRYGPSGARLGPAHTAGFAASG